VLFNNIALIRFVISSQIFLWKVVDMPVTNYEFEQFFDRDGFNKSLSHFQAVSGLLEDFESRYNLADILNSLLEDEDIKQNQLSPILYALLADKYGYVSVSHNMARTIEDFSELQQELKKWKGIDVVIAYHHPELGFTVINPKNGDHWDAVQALKRNELIVLYAGGFADEVDTKTANSAIKACIAFLDGKKIKSPDSLMKGKYAYKPFSTDEEEDEDVEPVRRSAPARRAPVRASSGDSSYESDEGEDEPASQAPPAPQPPPAAAESGGGARRMTPMYSVPVSNELFHNGNVEAWKKVIQSYETKYPGSEVSVFYEGEKIHDINTLFKWGKVKHGSTILFAILGNEIKDIAKLQRYLRQGASPQFEAFLRFPVNTVLKLF
jgi:hypothetical protein